MTAMWAAREGNFLVLFLWQKRANVRKPHKYENNTAYLRLEGYGMLKKRLAPLPTYLQSEELAL